MSRTALEKRIVLMARKAKTAALQLGLVTTGEKNRALRIMAAALTANAGLLIRENSKDLAAGQRAGLNKAILDRLALNEERIKGMAQGLLDTARLPDPTGQVMHSFKRPNGLKIKKIRVPIGVVGMIYESRPNVTSDCIGLCLKSGNAAILKGGKEAIYSNQAIFKILKQALSETSIPEGVIQLIPSRDRAAVNVLLKQRDTVDLIIPRGGEGLIRFVAENSHIPVVKHYKGVCHTYVAEQADLNMAHRICLNAKLQRPGVCNAMETMLVHREAAPRFLPRIIDEFKRAGVEVRGCPLTRKIVKLGVKRAGKDDWETEYLDLVLSVKVVASLQEAIDHINRFGSHHSDAIVTDDPAEAQEFLDAVDSACLYVNASTRFTDGYEFGFGAEIGISTDKLHARGPMGLEELTTYKYIVCGQGQIRE